MNFIEIRFSAIKREIEDFLKNQESYIDAVQKREKQSKKSFDERKALYNQYTNMNYASVLDSIKKSELQGDWILSIGDEVFEIKLSNNQNKFQDENSNKKMKVSYVQMKKIEMKQSVDVPFFIGDAFLVEKRKNVFVGKTEANEKITLKR